MDKICCPWCGHEMLPVYDRGGAVSYLICECEDCRATSPVATGDDAIEKAMRRPLQRPITLKEAYELCETEPCVFVEGSKHKAMVAAIVEEMMPERECDDPCAELHIPDRRGMVFASESLYGKRWRCWKTKPTDEERAAAPWDVER